MRKINIGAIFTYLNRTGSASRIELARNLDLDRKTITNLIRDLISSNLIVSKGMRQPLMGHPEEILSINQNGAHAIGITLEPYKISAGLVNLHGKMKNRKTESIPANETTENLLNKIQKIVTSLQKKVTSDNLVGVGLGYYGILDKQSGTINAANFPQMNGVRLYEFLESRIRLPFIAEDGSRCKTIAENWFGAARNTDNFVFLDVGTGIGAELFLMGQVAVGVSNEAGELGHTLIEPNGKLCKCGKKGCLETVSSTDAVENNFREQYPEHKNISYNEIANMALNGHKGAIAVIQKAGYYIGIALSNMLQIVNPGLVVFSGDMFNNTLIEETIDQTLAENLTSSSYKALTFKKSRIEDGNAEIGAAALILKNAFEKAV